MVERLNQVRTVKINPSPERFVRKILFAIGLLVISGITMMSCKTGTKPSGSKEKPNFIIILTDDQGYQDIGCYGSPLIRTPNLDQMAREGMRFTDFYAQTVCGPSRTALMTGCYPLRVATKNNKVDVHPWVHQDEITIADILKEVGYTSGCFGKWDLAGHSLTDWDPELMPTRQGFDYFFGTPTSNDHYVDLIRNEEVIEPKADMNTLTRRYTDEAIEFIRRNQDNPFFVYLPHTMPHTQLGVSEQFRDRSKRGLYGDVIEEIDWNVGRILDIIDELELDYKTYIIFTSDNGPWYSQGEHGGAAWPLRGAKGSTWEGGLRVPCIMRSTGRIPAGKVCDEITTTMDLLPTIAALSGGEIPDDRVIDGMDISSLIHGEIESFDIERIFYYYQVSHLQAVREGDWKLHLPRPANPPWCPDWKNFFRPENVFDIETPMLFNLKEDISEQVDVSYLHPGIVERLLELAEHGHRDIGDYNIIGRNARFFDPQPRRPDVAKWAKTQ
jgi:arylsulfatase